ncbi:hypothetical protein SRS16P2_00121 (plasmid) [Variovorax sp. SRS16]|uniref:DUF1330 domain-containing protein n=1 Tax=Variovorax sp. SRS16 TaxID=282217 RepID=UPI001318810D|nr:DUF1330 domain-containing protein [Variovorax sp. SRS16]VTU45386.1 hypothetical protein SRS16P2_00121 [Variovorax sp. SRS16]
MSAFFIAEMTIHDAVLFDEYRRLALPSLQRFAPKPVIRAQDFLMLEGQPAPSRLVIHEFSTKEIALSWFNSEEYQRAAEFRRRAATSRIMICDGAS